MSNQNQTRPKASWGKIAALLAVLTLPALTPAATINGTVRKLSDSTSLAGTKVYYLTAGVRADSATTDSVGGYSLINVPTGANRQVVAVLSGYATATLSVTLNQTTSVGTANFYLGAPGSISGFVRRNTDSLIVVGAKLYLRRNSTTSTILDSTVSDTGGTYVFSNIAPGTPNYFVTGTATGFASTSNSNIVVNSGANTVSTLYILTLGKITATVRKLSDSTAIANALVLLRRGTSDTSAILDSGRTNGSGVYTFSNLTASTGGGGGGGTQYRVYASSTGFISLTNTAISVSNGATTATNFYMGAIASISGTVRKAVDSTTLVNAAVYLRRTSATSTVIDSAKTDSLGRYAFANVVPGTPNYFITATFAGLATTTNSNIVVGSGAAVVSNIYVSPILPGSISGNIRKSADSTALAGAKIYLRRTSTTSAIEDSTVSDVSGAYAFDSLTAGTPNYFVTASAVGYATASNSNIVVNNGANTVSNVYLATLGKITARVRKLSDSTNIANALVLLRRGTTDTTAILDSARTDSLGSVTFSNLAASTGGGGGGATQYRVYASAAGFVNAQNTAISVSNGATTTTNLYLGLPGSIAGIVRKSSDSTAIAAAKVYLRRSSTTSAILDSATTNSLGEYSFASVSSGTPNYFITASAAAYLSATNSNVAVASGAAVTSNFYLTLVMPGSITGTVRKLPDSSVVAGTLMRLRRGSDTSAVLDSAVTDSVGRYTFANLQAGTPNYWVSATKAGLVPGSNTNISVPNGAAATSNFVLSVPATLSGTIRRLPDSLALRNALVQMRRGGSTSAIVDSARTDSLGRYAFSNLPPANNYRITASFTGYTTASNTNINVTSGSAVVSNLTLSALPTGKIYGKVGKASDSTTIANALIVLRRGSDTGAVVDSVRSNSQGRYQFVNVLSGTPNYWLIATAATFTADTNANVAVVANDSVLSDFVLTGVVSISRGHGLVAQQAFTATRAGTGWLIRIPAATMNRTFTMHDARGTVLHRAQVAAGVTTLVIPGTANQAGVMMRLD